MSEDSSFYYVNFYLKGYHPDGGLDAAYGVEIDKDCDGRGKLLVIVDRPASSTRGIAWFGIYRNAYRDVDGSRIMRPDASYGEDGYEKVLFSADGLGKGARRAGWGDSKKQKIRNTKMNDFAITHYSLINTLFHHLCYNDYT